MEKAEGTFRYQILFIFELALHIKGLSLESLFILLNLY